MAPTTATISPTAAGPTAAPTVNSTGAFTVKADFTLNYFTGLPSDVVRDLSEIEYQELTQLMDEFYTEWFTADTIFADEFQSYMTVPTGMTYDEAGDPHIFMPFDGNFVFTPGTSITLQQIIDRMDDADLQDFIVSYLMRKPPENQLDAVQRVTFDIAAENADAPI